MQQVTVQGTSVPALGLGTWQLTGPQCRQVVEDALHIGYRHIDTAQMYGNEDDVGAGIAASGVDPDELFVTTKLANDNHEPGAVRASVEASLRALRLDGVDLLLIHQPVATERLAATLGAMQALVDDGLVCHLGVSNFPVDLLGSALQVGPLFAIQVEYHALRTRDDQLTVAGQHDLLVQGYSPLARGAVTADPQIVEVARTLGATPAQVALRWLLDQPRVAAIPKASSRAHLEENWATLDVALDDETRRRLDRSAQRQLEAADVDD